MPMNAQSTASERIRPAQRAALFAIGTARGLDIDDLRAMTPKGSISALSFAEASALLSRLNAGTEFAHPRPPARQPRRPKGVYAFRTAAQLRKIEALRIELGWTPEGLDGFLASRKFRDGRPMNSIASTSDGRDAIELLKHVLACGTECQGEVDGSGGATNGTPSRSEPTNGLNATGIGSPIQPATGHDKQASTTV